MSDVSQYRKWIESYKGDIYRKCVEVTNQMKECFPELRIVKGLVTIVENGKEYPHQWLETVEGDIIDPTAKQWAGITSYRTLPEEVVSISKCVNCGEWILITKEYFNRETCSEKCYNEYLNYLIKGI